MVERPVSVKRHAIIGGTGVYDAFENVRKETIATAFGAVEVDIASLHETLEIVFLARHGKNHNTPPHRINYHANMKALKMLNVTHILATCAVGSMKDAYAPSDLVMITDFLDFTKQRNQTFFDGEDGLVAHVEMTDPYCNYLRTELRSLAEKHGVDFKGNAVYVCTEGPRFETAAEIKMYRLMGGDVVGMTNVPESVLAKELGICYQAVGVITNWCTGIEGKEITGHLIETSMASNKDKLTHLFLELLNRSLTQSECKCNQSLLVL